MTEIDVNDFRCYPFPRCPDYKQCAHAVNNKAVLAMNCMPHRVDGEPCKWFVQRVEVEA